VLRKMRNMGIKTGGDRAPWTSPDKVDTWKGII